MFNGMLNDLVTLVKKDGTVVKDKIKAMVQPKTIFMDDATLPIEPGDRLLRTLPSGLVDEYLVDEPGFFAGLSGMDAHFQTKVHRSDTPAAQPNTIINNIQGQNARVNINSTDNSQNIAISSDGSEIFEALHKVLEGSGIIGEDAQLIRKAIEEMEKAKSKESFQQSYVDFMSAAANDVAVFGPLLGALASFLA